MKKLVFYLVAFLFMTQMAVADYILISGGADTSANAGNTIIRYRDDFRVVWERSAAKGTPESLVFNGGVLINPLDPIYGGGDIYTVHYLNDRLVKHLAWETGD